jgi:hypothetical protein
MDFYPKSKKWIFIQNQKNTQFSEQKRTRKLRAHPCGHPHDEIQNWKNQTNLSLKQILFIFVFPISIFVSISIRKFNFFFEPKFFDTKKFNFFGPKNEHWDFELFGEKIFYKKKTEILTGQIEIFFELYISAIC